MRPGAQVAAEIAHQRADVIPAANDEPHSARAWQIVVQEARLVQVDPRRGQYELLAAMRAQVRALPVDPLVAGRRRNLVAPAEMLDERRVKLRFRERGGIARRHRMAEWVAVVGLHS